VRSILEALVDEILTQKDPEAATAPLGPGRPPAGRSRLVDSIRVELERAGFSPADIATIIVYNTERLDADAKEEVQLRRDRLAKVKRRARSKSTS
jgi:hypothetical protein